MAENAHRQRIEAFLDHSRSFDGLRYVYPVVSRRSGGLSIGINLNPDKRCNFDCVYCQVDRMNPPRVLHVDLEVLSSELEALLERVEDGRIWSHPRLADTPTHLRRLNDIAFSGDGEPTTEKHFREAVALSVDLLSRPELSGVIPILITDAACLHHSRVREGLDLMHTQGGVIWAKLDAGSEAFYRDVNRTLVPFSRVLANLSMAAQHYRVVIQSLFFRAHGEGPPESEIDAYCTQLEAIESEGSVEEVHIYTVARTPAEAWCTPLSDDEVDAIVAKVTERSVAPVKAFYGPPSL